MTRPDRSLARLVVACLLLAGCQGTTGKDPVEQTPLRIATDATFAPFHYIAVDGQPAGFDVELATLLAQRAGYTPIISVVPYDELFSELISGRHDVVAATTGITPAREQEYLFTAPYYDTCQAALVRVGDGEPTDLSGLAGRRVGAAGAGTSVRALEQLSNVERVLLNTGKPTIGDDGSVPVLDDRTVDALIVDEFDAVEAARASNGRLRVLAAPVALEQYALVLRPGDLETRQRLDDALAALRDDGTVERLERKYGLDRDEDWPIRLPR